MIPGAPQPCAAEAASRKARADRTPGDGPPPLASVIIVNYNGREHLPECLASLLRDPVDQCEIILVDNASADGSADYVEQAFPQVQVIRSKENLGFGRGNNLAARQARGSYLAFLNADTVVETGWLEALIKALTSDARIGLATSKILLLGDAQRINACGNDVHITGITLCRGMGLARTNLDSVKEVSAVSGAAFAMRRDLFEKLGGFDGSFFMYMEDTDLSWRARLAGYRCFCVPDSRVLHDYALRFGPEKTYYEERNRYVMLLKGLRWQTWLVLLPALSLAEVVTWGYVLWREPRRWRNKLRAYAWVVKHRSEIMEGRRGAQALRAVRDRDLLVRNTWRLSFEQSDSGWVGRLAHWVFDPLFFVLHRLALVLVRW